jgi:hypothetical protein
VEAICHAAISLDHFYFQFVRSRRLSRPRKFAPRFK